MEIRQWRKSVGDLSETFRDFPNPSLQTSITRTTCTERSLFERALSLWHLICLRNQTGQENPMTDAISRSGTKGAARGNDFSPFSVPVTSVQRVEADGVQVFYRAAGDPNAPIVLLLHGFPTSSFMLRELIPRMASDYRVIAPDL